RRRRFVDQFGDGTERQLTVAVDGKIFDVAFQELALRGGLKEFRRRPVDGNQRSGAECRRQQKTKTLRHQFGETVVVSLWDPVTACSAGSSNPRGVALWSGLKLPPLRSASSTLSTDGGSADS